MFIFFSFTICQLRVSRIDLWKSVGLRTSKFILSDSFDSYFVHNVVLLLYKVDRYLVGDKKIHILKKGSSCKIFTLTILDKITCGINLSPLL